MTPKISPEVRSPDDELAVEAAKATRAGAADTEIALGSFAGKSKSSPDKPGAAEVSTTVETPVFEPSAAGSVEGALAEAAVLASEGRGRAAAPAHLPVHESAWASAAGSVEGALAEAAVLASDEPEGAAAPTQMPAEDSMWAAGSMKGAPTEESPWAPTAGTVEGTPAEESAWAPSAGSVEGTLAEERAQTSAAGRVEPAPAEKSASASTAGRVEATLGDGAGEQVLGGVVSAGSISAEGGLAALLESVLVGEPPVQDGVDRVYRRAEALRRRRLRRVVASGAVAALLVAAVGYALTAAVIPGVRHTSTATPMVARPTPNVDQLLTALASVVQARGLRAVPREPSRGEGWRQYSVVDRTSGRPRGLIEVSAYAAPDGICFPVGNDPKACARAMLAGDGVEYARYSDDRDPDWQVHQAIARRLSDGRVIAVMATGERGTGDTEAGRPPLTVAETAGLAVAVPVMSAFDPSERCNGPDPACPVLKVPVPLER